MRAVLAAERLAVRFDAVADDAALAVRARRRELLDGALEAVERVGVATGHLHREGLFVAVAADFARTHGKSFQAARRLRAGRLALAAGFFSTLFLSSVIRSITSAPLAGFSAPSSGSVSSSVWPAFTFSLTRLSRSSR